ncbi:MAG: ArsR family transcriptional regulator [Thermoanaerobaculia bacterium]
MSNPLSIVGPGIGESQRRLLELMKRSGECTLAQLEAGFELNRETLRIHLKSLAAQGLVERSGVRRAGPGRPHVLYRLTAAGESLFPRREGALLRELATFLLEQGQSDVLEKFFAARLARKSREVGQRMAGLEGRERLDKVAEVLSEEGFVAEVMGPKSAPRLRLCHCPIRDLVAVSDLPCRFELALIEGLLGDRLARDSFMPEGSHACVYSIASARAKRQDGGGEKRAKKRSA